MVQMQCFSLEVKILALYSEQNFSRDITRNAALAFANFLC